MTINLPDIKHILVTRTDNIGDVILTLPLCGILKSHFPSVKITFLAKNYVEDVARHCACIDEFLSWDALSAMPTADAIAFLKQQKIDIVLHVFPNHAIAALMKAAQVPHRIGTSRRLHSWWTCNERVHFSRAHSTLHEAQLNLQLLKPLGLRTEYSLNELNNLMGLCCDKGLSAHLESYLKKDRFNLIVHPLTNKHTLEWPLSYFRALICDLPADQFNIIVTGSAKERQIIQEHIMTAGVEHATNIAGECSLEELMQLIIHSDGLVANATGPLHLAAGLGIRTLGLFPGIPGINPTRWGPVGKKAEYIVATDTQSKTADHMQSISVQDVRNVIIKWAS